MDSLAGAMRSAKSLVALGTLNGVLPFACPGAVSAVFLGRTLPAFLA